MLLLSAPFHMLQDETSTLDMNTIYLEMVSFAKPLGEFVAMISKESTDYLSSNTQCNFSFR